MFPEQNFKNENHSAEGNDNKTSFCFDFEKGDFIVKDGKVMRCDGLEAVKVWISKILRTEKFKFDVYSDTEYGVKLEDFISSGYSYDFVKTEIEKEVKDALLKNSEIKNVYHFMFERNKRQLICNFKVDTVYGILESEIRI